MRVAQLWRDPVKSLRCESLAGAVVTDRGIEGDRLVHAKRAAGRVFTARTHPGMLGLRGGLDTDGVPTIDGIRWDEPGALAAIRSVTEPDAGLKIVFELDSRTALDCYVIRPGLVRVGDEAGLGDWWTLATAEAAAG